MLGVEIGAEQSGQRLLWARHPMAVAPTRCPATVHPSSRSSTPGIGATDAGEALSRAGVRAAASTFSSDIARAVPRERSLLSMQSSYSAHR